MSQKHYDAAVLGATFLGIGAALSLKNVVMIEKGGLFGEEFVNSYKVCKPKDVKPETRLGNDFLCDLKKRGLVSESGEIYPAPAVYVVSSYLEKNPIDILLMTEVIRIEKIEGYYQITVYHTGGFERILAKRIIDTTAIGVGYNAEGQAVPMEKSLNAIVYNPDGKQLDGLTFNAQTGLYTYTLPVDLHASRHDAVESLCAGEKIFEENNMRISSIASDFAYTMEPIHKVIDSYFVWDPSTAYDNLVEAFDRGAQIAEEYRSQEERV